MAQLLSADAPLAALDTERSRVVRFCAHLTGDPHAAEDLAQETMLEAWRHEHELRDPDKRAQWLSGIARNVCRRWARGRGRELSRTARPADGAEEGQGLDSLPADDYDLEVELERDELARLLDRAMALLPAPTRDVLVGRLVEELPQREVAGRLGISEAAVAVKLQRGKLYLRRVLTSRMPAEAAAYGLLDADAETWQETRIWCPRCGRRRLEARWAIPHLDLRTRCPACYGNAGHDQSLDSEAYRDLKGFKAAFRRSLQSGEHARRCVSDSPGLSGRHCDPQLKVRPWDEPYGMQWSCDACRSAFNGRVEGFAIATPEGRSFWREHPKLHTLLGEEIEAGGRCAVPVALHSLTGAARLEIVFALDNFEVLKVCEASAPPARFRDAS